MHHSASSRPEPPQPPQKQQEHPPQASSSSAEQQQEQAQRAPAPGTSSSQHRPAAAQPTLHAFLQPFTTSPFSHHKTARRLQPPTQCSQPPRAKLAGSSSAAAGAADGASAAGSSGGQQHKGRQTDPSRLPTRKSVLYENCRLLAPDAAVLCTCSRKKVRGDAGSPQGRAQQEQQHVRVVCGWVGGWGGMVCGSASARRTVLQTPALTTKSTAAASRTPLLHCIALQVLWYVERGLGDIVQQEPLTVQLRFEPRGRGHADDKYYLSDKQNRCGGGGEVQMCHAWRGAAQDRATCSARVPNQSLSPLQSSALSCSMQSP
jgi:hypothetical protein